MKRIALAIALLGILGAACGTAAAQDTSAPVQPIEASAPVVDDTEIVADMTQTQAVAQGIWTDFCLGLDIFDYETAYQYFAEGFGSDDAEGRAVFDELASRC